VDRLLLRPTEVAEMIGVSRSVVYELLASGRLESVKLNASRRVPRDAVERFIAELRG
jgi:excisionase family DNA binding protein